MVRRFSLDLGVKGQTVVLLIILHKTFNSLGPHPIIVEDRIVEFASHPTVPRGRSLWSAPNGS